MNKQTKVEIIKDSIGPDGKRLTTFILEFPRIILAELNTHRVFSKNSASSRAIPFNKMVKSVQENPFIPIAFQKHHKGMQGNEYFTDPKEIEELQNLWLKSRDKAVEEATTLYNAGVTKQLCNRLLEPFMYHKVLLTATEFDNFFDLRCPKYITPVGGYDENGTPYSFKSKKETYKNHSNENNIKMMDNFTTEDWLNINQGQAEIHMMDLAEKMYDALNESIPEELEVGEWHIPFSDKLPSLSEWMDDRGISRELREEYASEWIENIFKIVVARCARVSYQTVGDNPTIDFQKDFDLYDSLKSSKHWSPFEHIAQVVKEDYIPSNFKGFNQLRHLLDK